MTFLLGLFLVVIIFNLDKIFRLWNRRKLLWQGIKYKFRKLNQRSLNGKGTTD